MTDNLHTIGETAAAGRLDRILFTRCPVPAASGIAHALGGPGGTPRPITVSQDLLDTHFDVVARFRAQTLRAAGVEAADRNNFHRSLHPDLSEERVALLKRQVTFLWLPGFLEHAADIDAWIDRRPLEAALERRAGNRAA
ncbi:MAG TPA: hypothetical protein VMQ93_12175 [Novosphingobium sp.]|nr:hypothetical protein [Novosphingobium sp.]